MFNNPVCEDAPCCGCCGAAVQAAEDASAQEWAMDPDRFYDQDYDDYDEDE